MRTVKDIEQIAEKEHYQVIKNSPDNYDLYETGAVLDFTKPIKINREIPPLASHKAYNGVPLYLFTYTFAYYINFELWCYVMNKKDGDYIHFNDILNTDIQYCKDIEDIVFNFDLLVHHGYLRERKDCLEFYAYPIKDGIQLPLDYIFQQECNKKVSRLAPFKYLE